MVVWAEGRKLISYYENFGFHYDEESDDPEDGSTPMIQLPRAQLTEMQQDGFTQSRLFQAIYRHRREQVTGDEGLTWNELRNQVRDLKSHLKFPLVVYRGLRVHLNHDQEEALLDQDQDINLNWDAHSSEICDPALTRALVAEIDFSALGTSWTWSYEHAVTGGAIGGMSEYDGETNIVLSATIQSNQCDLLVTYYQNLSVYEEEKEIRLYSNIPLTIRAIHPSNSGVRLPLRGNSGSEGMDDRQSVLLDMLNALRKPEDPYVFPDRLHHYLPTRK